jgi:hypothetical protein
MRLTSQSPLLTATALAVLLLFLVSPALAVLQVDGDGPKLQAGSFSLRVTNAGILGNAFFEEARSPDPSFEYPRGSGIELLHHAEVWVGARRNGTVRVSGGPLLEWRPTREPEDRIVEARHSLPGTRRLVDDDNDGRLDEEALNGLDDDGDGAVDEDLALFAEQVMASTYRDDQPEALAYVSPSGEAHSPLRVSVHEEAFTWSIEPYASSAAFEFTLTNASGALLEDVYFGLMVDFDSRRTQDPTDHRDDVMRAIPVSASVFEGRWDMRIGGAIPIATRDCFTRIDRTVYAVHDGDADSDLPAIGVVPLTHTTDPLAFLRPDLGTAPARVAFRSFPFSLDFPPGQGGPPVIDDQRYRALSGQFPTTELGAQSDQAVLISCGPFPRWAPNQRLQFSIGLVAAPHVDSIANRAAHLLLLQHGGAVNELPDSSSLEYNVGETGLHGHEACIEPPPGFSFEADPHCVGALRGMVLVPPQPEPVTYQHGACVWTNADCDLCTGLNGNETWRPWLEPGTVPPSPGFEIEAADKAMLIRWDNLPELVMGAGTIDNPEFQFAGYRVYRVSEWPHEQLLPPPQQWELLAAYSSDTLDGQLPLDQIRNDSMASTGTVFGAPYFPVGRYEVIDRDVFNGFDYAYLVTTVAHRFIDYEGRIRIEEIESPLILDSRSLVRPRAAARSAPGPVWVVPNPYRGRADWDRPAVPGDPFPRHIDFLGLPIGPSRLRIWTVAGDLVADLRHDGDASGGQLSWNLLSRNGQEVASGIYVFTLDSQSGASSGRFVVIR